MPARSEWGAPLVAVTHADGKWTIAGEKNKVTLNELDLAIRIDAGTDSWKLMPSAVGDLVARINGRDINLRLADARTKRITSYDTGFKTGVKIQLADWPSKGEISA